MRRWLTLILNLSARAGRRLWLLTAICGTTPSSGWPSYATPRASPCGTVRTVGARSPPDALWLTAPRRRFETTSIAKSTVAVRSGSLELLTYISPDR
jgi:hypothetical protein